MPAVVIKNMLRVFAALSLSLSPLVVPASANAVPAAAAAQTFPLSYAIGQIPVAEESRAGYTRDKFKHWNAGLDRADGCNTRAEVLLAEASEAPTVSAGCKLTDGEWLSYYDEQEVSDPAKLDIDHMVPLAEAWDSGASTWSAARREAYANDQEAATSLVAVTARTNRQKADQDPSGWMPPAPTATCRYLAEWTATKLRWGLTADQGEIDTINVYAGGPCQMTVVHYIPAP
ncbi:HNH endonuclease family protein [Streptomyces canus]|uniref:HNH endonuclease family protein n=1 Tax=Streptomyces canus TaxID=58343 RepID=UPI002250A731|nr:HNH endonuclease family protein [Streptomyces canus]MCX4853790.1 HNH endonuclease family protein [Streptomyces canus]